MAKATAKLPDEFLEKLSRMGERADEIAEKVLEAGGEVVLAAVRSSLASAVGSGTKFPSRATGELQGSLGLTTVKLDKNGNYNIKVGFAEPRSGGGSNAKIANILEYGKHGQPAKPFLKPAISRSKDACIKAMTDVLEQEVGK